MYKKETLPVLFYIFAFKLTCKQIMIRNDSSRSWTRARYLADSGYYDFVLQSRFKIIRDLIKEVTIKHKIPSCSPSKQSTAFRVTRSMWLLSARVQKGVKEWPCRLRSALSLMDLTIPSSNLTMSILDGSRSVFARSNCRWAMEIIINYWRYQNNF